MRAKKGTLLALLLLFVSSGSIFSDDWDIISGEDNYREKIFAIADQLAGLVGSEQATSEAKEIEANYYSMKKNYLAWKNEHNKEKRKAFAKNVDEIRSEGVFRNLNALLLMLDKTKDQAKIKKGEGLVQDFTKTLAELVDLWFKK